MIPIVLIHKGVNWYLPYTIYQLKQTNKKTPIFLIGDQSTKHFQSLINHINIEPYLEKLEEFTSVYHHHSQNGFEFEFFCIARWMVLNQFIKEQQFSRVVYLDSDILVYQNLSVLESQFPDYKMTWLGNSAHTNYIKDDSVLDNFSKFIISMYKGDLSQHPLYPNSRFYLRGAGIVKGNISDMSFFHDFNLFYPNLLLDISSPINESIFDITITTTNGYECVNGMKKIRFLNKIPFVISSDGKNMVWLNTIHFQGYEVKKMIPDYFVFATMSFLGLKILNSLVIFLNKVKHKITGYF